METRGMRCAAGRPLRTLRGAHLRPLRTALRGWRGGAAGGPGRNPERASLVLLRPLPPPAPPPARITRIRTTLGLHFFAPRLQLTLGLAAPGARRGEGPARVSVPDAWRGDGPALVSAPGARRGAGSARVFAPGARRGEGPARVSVPAARLGEGSARVFGPAARWEEGPARVPVRRGDGPALVPALRGSAERAGRGSGRAPVAPGRTPPGTNFGAPGLPAPLRLRTVSVESREGGEEVVRLRWRTLVSAPALPGAREAAVPRTGLAYRAEVRAAGHPARRIAHGLPGGGGGEAAGNPWPAPRGLRPVAVPPPGDEEDEAPPWPARRRLAPGEVEHAALAVLPLAGAGRADPGDAGSRGNRAGPARPNANGNGNGNGNGRPAALPLAFAAPGERRAPAWGEGGLPRAAGALAPRIPAGRSPQPGLVLARLDAGGGGGRGAAGAGAPTLVPDLPPRGFHEAAGAASIPHGWGAPVAVSSAGGEVDVQRVTDEVYRRFEQKLRIERERRGL